MADKPPARLKLMCRVHVPLACVCGVVQAYLPLNGQPQRKKSEGGCCS